MTACQITVDFESIASCQETTEAPINQPGVHGTSAKYPCEDEPGFILLSLLNCARYCACAVFFHSACAVFFHNACAQNSTLHHTRLLSLLFPTPHPLLYTRRTTYKKKNSFLQHQVMTRFSYVELHHALHMLHCHVAAFELVMIRGLIRLCTEISEIVSCSCAAEVLCKDLHCPGMRMRNGFQ